MADLVRSADEMVFAKETMDVLLNDAYSKSAWDRSESIDQLLRKLGAKVNPQYAKKISEISQANLAWRADGRTTRDSNAPGSLGRL
jgi:hypothetical protein